MVDDVIDLIKTNPQAGEKYVQLLKNLSNAIGKILAKVETHFPGSAEILKRIKAKIDDVLDKRVGKALAHTKELTDYLYKRIVPTDLKNAKHFEHHNMPLEKQAEILNDWEQFIRGTNKSGKQVDIFYKDGRVVITEAGNKTSVITAYGREFSAKGNPVKLKRWNFRSWKPGEFYYSPIHRNPER